MNAFDWALIVAVCAIAITVIHYCHRGDDRQWRESTGRTPQTVADDVAELRKAHEVEQLEAWLATPCQPRNTIPHQRQPRKDQP
jgi:hypothetical protein